MCKSLPPPLPFRSGAQVAYATAAPPLHNHAVEICTKNYGGAGGRVDEGRCRGPGHLPGDSLRGFQQQHQHWLPVLAQRGQCHANQLRQCRLSGRFSGTPLQVQHFPGFKKQMFYGVENLRKCAGCELND